MSWAGSRTQTTWSSHQRANQRNFPTTNSTGDNNAKYDECFNIIQLQSLLHRCNWCPLQLWSPVKALLFTQSWAELCFQVWWAKRTLLKPSVAAWRLTRSSPVLLWHWNGDGLDTRTHDSGNLGGPGHKSDWRSTTSEETLGKRLFSKMNFNVTLVPSCSEFRIKIYWYIYMNDTCFFIGGIVLCFTSK